MTLRYDKKLTPFPSRFSDEQRKKIKKVSEQENVSEAEAVRIMIDAYAK